MISTNLGSDEEVSSNNAINITGTNNYAIVYASKGGVYIGVSNDFKAIFGQKVITEQNLQVDYEFALTSIQFSGPSGAYSIVDGTYRIR